MKFINEHILFRQKGTAHRRRKKQIKDAAKRESERLRVNFDDEKRDTDSAEYKAFREERHKNTTKLLYKYRTTIEHKLDYLRFMFDTEFYKPEHLVKKEYEELLFKLSKIHFDLVLECAKGVLIGDEAFLKENSLKRDNLHVFGNNLHVFEDSCMFSSCTPPYNGDGEKNKAVDQGKQELFLKNFIYNCFKIFGDFDLVKQKIQNRTEHVDFFEKLKKDEKYGSGTWVKGSELAQRLGVSPINLYKLLKTLGFKVEKRWHFDSGNTVKCVFLENKNE